MGSPPLEVLKTGVDKGMADRAVGAVLLWENRLARWSPEVPSSQHFYDSVSCGSRAMPATMPVQLFCTHQGHWKAWGVYLVLCSDKEPVANVSLDENHSANAQTLKLVGIQNQKLQKAFKHISERIQLDSLGSKNISLVLHTHYVLKKQGF